MVVCKSPHVYGDCGPAVRADSKAFEKKKLLKNLHVICPKWKI